MSGQGPAEGKGSSQYNVSNMKCWIAPIYLIIDCKHDLLKAIWTHCSIGDLEVVDALTTVRGDLVIEIGGYAIARLPASSRERSIGARRISNTSTGCLSRLNGMRIWSGGNEVAKSEYKSTAELAG